MTKKKLKGNFERDLNRLEEISILLEAEDVDLEDAMTLFEEGVKLSKSCLKKLKEAELKITELKKEIGKFAEVKED